MLAHPGFKTADLPIPGVLLGSYPEREEPSQERAMLLRPAVSSEAGLKDFLAQVHAADAAMPATIAATAVQTLRARLSREGLTDALIAECFALVGKISASVLGKTPYDCQWVAARIILDNRLAEMATGEGKTLAACIAAATAALAGIPVHVVTANDYLAERDAQLLGPLYRALGLTVGTILQPLDREARKREYQCNVVYCTARELAFDYLRDGLSGERQRSELHRQADRIGADHGANSRGTLLRGLCMAIVDEADSILIDEARVPLVISGRTANAQTSGYANQAMRFAAELAPERDFVLDRRNMKVELTDAGKARLEETTETIAGAWRNRLHREETIATAIAALHLYQRDRDYLVRNRQVTIIDDATGRASPGRQWSRGLHQFVELKEGCPASDETTTLAQITYQRFFQRYLCLGGMSGTLREARAELASVYGLQVVAVAPHRPCLRTLLPLKVFHDRAAHTQAILQATKETSRLGRPVLIGTGSVADSQLLSAAFAAAGIVHRVLNASQDRQEAAVVANAGQSAQVTIATNMAGRGTDIALGPGINERGGLHVICTHRNASARIDRQLVGRCARQGEPGSAQFLLCADGSNIADRIARRIAKPAWLIALVVRWPQWLRERRQRFERRALLRRDLHAEEFLSFGKPHE
jgi:preprotein translocase subunit SecA